MGAIRSWCFYHDIFETECTSLHVSIMDTLVFLRSHFIFSRTSSVVAIRSSLYGLNRFLDKMGVAQHRVHGTCTDWRTARMYMKRRLSKTSWNAVLSYGAHQHGCCCYSIKFVRLESISRRNGSSATSRTWHLHWLTFRTFLDVMREFPFFLMSN